MSEDKMYRAGTQICPGCHRPVYRCECLTHQREKTHTDHTSAPETSEKFKLRKAFVDALNAERGTGAELDFSEDKIILKSNPYWIGIPNEDFDAALQAVIDAACAGTKVTNSDVDQTRSQWIAACQVALIDGGMSDELALNVARAQWAKHSKVVVPSPTIVAANIIASLQSP